MTDKPFVAAFAKIEWAKSHINDLAQLSRSTYRVPILINAPKISIDRPTILPIGLNKISSHVDNNGVEVWRYQVPEIPESMTIIVGNILHNLRAPLDQMLTEIALITDPSPRHVSFPFGRTKQFFEANLAKEKKLPADAKKLIAKLKPYGVGGNTLLYALHRLDVSDKHYPGLIPINLNTVTNFSQLVVRSGAILSIGPRTGNHFIVDANRNFFQPDISKMPHIKLINGMSSVELGHLGKPEIGIRIMYNQSGTTIPDAAKVLLPKLKLPPGSSKDDMEVATSLPGTKFEAEFYPSFNIALADIEGFEREPVVAVLQQMCDLVERILLTFRSRFYP